MANNERLSRDELIDKLKTISGLYENAQQIQAEMDEFEPQDHYERKIEVPAFPGDFPSEQERDVWADRLDHTDENAVEVAEAAHRKFYAPKEPTKPGENQFQKPSFSELENKRAKFGGLSKLSAGIAIFFFLGILLNLNDEYSVLPTMITITLIAAAVFVLLKYMAKTVQAQIDEKTNQAQLAHNSLQQQIMEDYEKKYQSYKRECEKYEVVLKQFLEEYKAWREIYIKRVKEEAKIEKQLAADRKAAVEKIYQDRYIPAEAALSAENDLVSEDYLPVLNVLIDLLRSGRADGLKEAINLYEELVYRERQLQLQREQEEQRRYEEQQRREDEERRYREDMKFRQEQEYQRQREEQQRRSDEERRHREDMRAREAQERSRQLAEKERIRKEEYRAHMDKIEQERKQRNAGQAQCRACAHAGRCNISIHNNAPTCTGFTPRR